MCILDDPKLLLMEAMARDTLFCCWSWQCCGCCCGTNGDERFTWEISKHVWSSWDKDCAFWCRCWFTFLFSEASSLRILLVSCLLFFISFFNSLISFTRSSNKEEAKLFVPASWLLGWPCDSARGTPANSSPSCATDLPWILCTWGMGLIEGELACVEIEKFTLFVT